MSPFRTILFPIDFSQAVLGMVPYAREMAQRFDGSVTVLHVFHLVPDYALPPRFEREWEGGRIVIPYTPALQKLRNESQQNLEQFASTHFPNIRHEARIEDGEPASIIEWIVQRENIDLIVMPTRGHGKFHRLLLGSVTAKVLHDISCPVLTSAHQPDAALAATGDYRCILCAVETNREADEILAAGGLLARAFGARLSLVHMQSASSRPNAGQDVAESVRQVFRQALNHYTGSGVKASVHVFETSVPEGIRRAAIEEGADLVVVGRGHEKGTLSRLWSPLYTIIRESPCAVLSV